jgi:hypothetical protein
MNNQYLIKKYLFLNYIYYIILIIKIKKVFIIMSKIIGNIITGSASALAGHFIGKTINIKNQKHYLALGGAALTIGLLTKKATGASLMNMALCFVGGMLSNNQQVKNFFTSILDNGQKQSQNAPSNKVDT